MSVFLAWSDVAFETSLPGPWVEIHIAAPGLALIDSAATLSRVYHELKWSLPDDAALFVGPLTGGAKLKLLSPGTMTWLRSRMH